MKRVFLIIFCIAPFFSFSQTISPKQVIEKYLDAIGGIDNLNQVKDMSLEANSEIQGQNMIVITKKKSPNKFFTSVTVDGMGEINKTVFDGKKGFVNAMGQEQRIEGDAVAALEAQSGIFGELAYLNDLEKITYVGQEMVENINCYVLKMTTSMGDSKEYYEIESGLKKRQITDADTPMGKTTITIDYADYKWVNGVKFPYLLKQDLGMFQMELIIKEIKVNTGIPDADFIVE